MQRKISFFFIGLLIWSAACSAPFRPTPIADTGVLSRAKTETQGKLTVSTLALGPKESEEVFGLKMAKRGIQPVWLKIFNGEKYSYLLMPISMDPEYYSPNEVAVKTRPGHSKAAKEEIEQYLNEHQFPYRIPPGETYEGYVYTQLTHGAKEVNVDLLGDKELRSYRFIVPVPGLKVDYDQIDFDKIYSPGDYKTVGLEELRAALEAYPCCTSNKKGNDQGGDVINFVLVGDDEDILAAFIRRGWRQTEVRYKSSIFKTLKSFLFKSEYDNSPVSDLFVFDRHQDMAWQKPRKSIHFRNHLRLWLTPLEYKGKAVWLGAISRDIGVKGNLHSPFFMTHRIDSDVDEARDYLLTDFIASGSVKQFAYVTGSKPSSYENPRKNFTGDPIYTDGLRVVMFISDEQISVVDVDAIDWETPPQIRAPVRAK